MMGNDELLELYLRKMIEFCEEYDAFSIPAAAMAGGTGIKLQDVYTHLSFVGIKEYESRNNSILDIGITKDGTQDSGVDKMLAEIDTKIAELEKEQSKSQEVSLDELSYKTFKEENDSEGLEKNDSNLQKGDFGKLIRKTFRDDNNTEVPLFDGDEESGSQEKEELNWIWFLSVPGGGKTTLLKMYSLAYAYKYYVGLYGKKEELFGDCQAIKAIERICDELGVTEGACPFFISVRSLKEEDYPDVSESDGFIRVIINVIKAFVEIDISDCEANQLLLSIKKPIYIIDSVEEFSSTRFRELFLKGLDVFSCGNKCYLSSRYHEYMENVKETSLLRDGIELSAKEYVIDGLTLRYGEQKDKVREFVERWYAALNRISGRENLDVVRDFLVPLWMNPDVAYLTENPLELTSLLMISSYDSCLPSDFVKIYGRSIELWLSWNNYARYNYEDVMRQLSQVAYQMAVSENEKIVVRHDTLEKYIRQSRKDLKRYYQQEWLEDESSIDDFIQFLCRSHLISKSTEGYDFIHRQYQAYLVAYCITTNNFSRKIRKKSRLDYIEEHIREKDDFWNQIIIIIVMLDIELRDDIISALFSLSDNRDNSEISDSNYYVSLLIQLAVMPGVNFDDYELKKLFYLIMRDEKSWRLFNSQMADLMQLFRLNEEHGNELFIKTALNRNSELSGINRDRFRDRIATTIFYCIWHCKVNEQCVHDVINAFFKNYLNIRIIETLYISREHTTDKQRIVKEAAVSLGRNSLEANDYSNYYMLIAAIVGYENDGSPYNCIDRLISQKKFESDVIAVNILVIATWLIQCDEAFDYGYDKSGGLTRYSEFILRGILDDAHEKIRRDYLIVFSDAFSIGETINHEENWFNETVFEHIFRIAISEYKDNESLLDENNGSFSKCFEHISLYPCEYSVLCKKLLKEMNYEPFKLIEKIKDIYKKTENLIGKVRAGKLLLLLSDMQYDERKTMIREIGQAAKNYKLRHKLRRDHLEQAFSLSFVQMIKYIPEGSCLLKNLDLPSVNFDLPSNLWEKVVYYLLLWAEKI